MKLMAFILKTVQFRMFMCIYSNNKMIINFKISEVLLSIHLWYNSGVNISIVNQKFLLWTNLKLKECGMNGKEN